MNSKIDIQPFEQYCTQPKPCGEIVSQTERTARVRRYAVWKEGKIIKLSDSKEEATEFVIAKGWTLGS